MSDIITIPNQPDLNPAEDYEALRKEGVRYIQELSSKIWTDHNLHDPGITSLELLCYAITDLGYRTRRDMKDLLMHDPEKPLPPQDSFHTAAQIFPVNPTTELDWRKLVIDVRGIRNAWLRVVTEGCPCDPVVYVECPDARFSYRPLKKKSKALQMNGLLEVIVQYDEQYVVNDVIRDEVRKAVWDTLQAHRNLCEDFCGIREACEEEIGLCADIHISPEYEVNRVMAQVLFELENFLNPRVRFYSLEEMLAKGKTPDEAFDGPLLQHGFIDKEELIRAQRRTEIHASDLINIIMDIPGVEAVNDFQMSSYVDGIVRNAGQRWCMRLYAADCGVPVLKLNRTQFSFYIGQLPFVPDAVIVNEHLRDIRADQVLNKPGMLASDLPVPQGQYFDLAAYTPVINEFPAVYGIGTEGLPAEATEARRHQARQFKAYLLLFDQLLANYLKQLAHIKDMFAWSDGRVIGSDPPLDIATYYTQLVSDVRELESLYWLGAAPGDMNNPVRPDIADWIRNLSETETQRIERRNRFLNHLIARFAEDFVDFSLAYSNSALSTLNNELLYDKAEFLRDYPIISRDRGKGFDQHGMKPILPHGLVPDVWDTMNIEGVTRRIARKLGIDDPSRRNLLCADFSITESSGDYTLEIYLPYLDGVTPQTITFTAGPFEEEFEAEAALDYFLDQAFVYDHVNPVIGTTDPLSFTGTFEPVISVNAYQFTGNSLGSEAAFMDAWKQIRDARLALTESVCEGLFTVEHILLRPHRKYTDPFLKACIQCCDEGDPNGGYQDFTCYRLDRTGNSGNYEFSYSGIPCADTATETDVTEEVLLKSVTASTFTSQREAIIDRVQELGASWVNYVLTTTPENDASEWKFEIIDPATGLALAVSTRDYGTQTDPLTQITADAQSLVNYFAAQSDVSSLEVLTEASGCEACQYQNDPYSFRVSYIFPGYSGRFRDADFREAAERMIRLETPAHIEPRICWISRHSMQRFENAWQAWLLENCDFRQNIGMEPVSPYLDIDFRRVETGVINSLNGIRLDLRPILGSTAFFSQEFQRDLPRTVSLLAAAVNQAFGRGKALAQQLFNPATRDMSRLRITFTACWVQNTYNRNMLVPMHGGYLIDQAAVTIYFPTGEQALLSAGVTTFTPPSPVVPPLSATLGAVIDALSEMDNYYPVASRLHDCVQGDDENTIILNHSKLGNN